MRRGFTLIELLVVIAIIGILSSVVLAALNIARENGRLAAGKQFAAALDHDLGANAAGWWDFDECSGYSVQSDGQTRNAAWSGTPGWTTTTPEGRGCAASLSGTNYVGVPIGSTNPTLNIPGDVTLAAWIYPIGGVTGDQVIIRGGVVADEAYALIYARGTNQIRFGWYTGTTFAAVSSTANLIKENAWNHVAAVREGADISFYINGAHAGTVVTVTSPGSFTPGSLEIGAAAYGAVQMFVGYIDRVRVYAGALTP